MMETKAHYALIGLFVLIALTGLASFSVWLGQSSVRNSYDIYDIYFDAPVRGLQEAADVRLNGIKVGDVTQVKLDKKNYNRVLTRIRVTSGTPIKQDVVAQLEIQGITGLSYVLITGGSVQTPMLRDVSEVSPPVIRSQRSELQGVLEQGIDVIKAIEKTLVKLQGVLNQENAHSLTDTLVNISFISQKLREAEENQEGFVAMMASIKKAADEVSRIAGTLNNLGQSHGADLAEGAQETLKSFHQAAQEIDSAAQKASDIFEGLETELKGNTGNALEQMNITIEALRRLTEQLHGTVTAFENNPGAFLLGKSAPETVLPE